MGAIPSVPSRFSVLFPSPLLHASRGQAWSPRARTKQSLPSRFSQSPVCVFQTRQSLPSRFSQSLVCFFLSLEQHDPISAMWARRVLPPCLLHASRRQNVASSSKHDPICATSVGSVKVLCVFFLSLERARSHLCQVVSVCYSHLVCSTHLVDKRGSLEQERSSLYHLGSVKVLCVFFKRGNLYHLGLVKVLSFFLLSLEQHDPISAMWARRVLPSCLPQESRGQTWHPRASTNQSLPCRLSQSVVSVFLNP